MSKINGSGRVTTMRSGYAALSLAAALLAATPAWAADDAGDRAAPGAAATLGLGIGAGAGHVGKGGCPAAVDCSGDGGVYLGRAQGYVFAGPVTIGARYVRQLDNNARAAEEAGLIGVRLGAVSLMAGPGRIRDPNEHANGETVSVLSWELLIAPHGRHYQVMIHGADGDAGYAALSLGFSLGRQ